MQSLIANHMTCHLLSHNLYLPFQFAYCKYDSTGMHYLPFVITWPARNINIEPLIIANYRPEGCIFVVWSMVIIDCNRYERVTVSLRGRHWCGTLLRTPQNCCPKVPCVSCFTYTWVSCMGRESGEKIPKEMSKLKMTQFASGPMYTTSIVFPGGLYGSLWFGSTL